MALGAVRANVLWMILRESTMIFAIGIAIGFPMAWAAAKLLRTQLYQLNYLDPASFILAGSITLAVTLTAAFIPARKASLVEPTEALRSE
jgi:ABC-type antimicrobial peptide transport system permease subunit